MLLLLIVIVIVAVHFIYFYLKWIILYFHVRTMFHCLWLISVQLIYAWLFVLLFFVWIAYIYICSFKSTSSPSMLVSRLQTFIWTWWGSWTDDFSWVLMAITTDQFIKNHWTIILDNIIRTFIFLIHITEQLLWSFSNDHLSLL